MEWGHTGEKCLNYQGNNVWPPFPIPQCPLGAPGQEKGVLKPRVTPPALFCPPVTMTAPGHFKDRFCFTPSPLVDTMAKPNLSKANKSCQSRVSPRTLPASASHEENWAVGKTNRDAAFLAAGSTAAIPASLQTPTHSAGTAVGSLAYPHSLAGVPPPNTPNH